MDWNAVAEKISPLKNLANNEEIKDKLESLSLYNSSLRRLLDEPEGSAELQQAEVKESELKDNTLAKIYEIQKQVELAKTPEEEASKLIECFLYIDNYLSLYSEPEFFFIETQKKLLLCDSVELLNSKIKFDDIVQSMFFFQELNTKAHISVSVLCNFLRESKTNVSGFIDTIDYAIDKLDFLNRAVFEQKKSDEALKQLYPFILLINFTAQKLTLHRFTDNYPSNVNKKVFQQALKQREYALDRIKGKILKRAEIIKQLKEQIAEPMNQEVWFDSRCVEVYDEEIVAKREAPETGDGAASVIITADKINRCCTVSYWIAFLMANTQKLNSGETNTEADQWLNLYLAVSKKDRYELKYSLRNFLAEKEIGTSHAFNNLKIKPVKANKESGPSVFDKVMPLWLVGTITACISAVFIYFIISAAKSITL
ncbi:MAG: hypothetical protein FWH43_04580 [Endomicrobia bacterium]|nr:hypothetical protein [Endomicrobiia bacterium]